MDGVNKSNQGVAKGLGDVSRALMQQTMTPAPTRTSSPEVKFIAPQQKPCPSI